MESLIHVLIIGDRVQPSLCLWFSCLSVAQMQCMPGNEPGGINEMYADQMSNRTLKYINFARKF